MKFPPSLQPFQRIWIRTDAGVQISHLWSQRSPRHNHDSMMIMRLHIFWIYTHDKVSFRVLLHHHATSGDVNVTTGKDQSTHGSTRRLWEVGAGEWSISLNSRHTRMSKALQWASWWRSRTSVSHESARPLTVDNEGKLRTFEDIFWTRFCFSFVN